MSPLTKLSFSEFGSAPIWRECQRKADARLGGSSMVPPKYPDRSAIIEVGRRPFALRSGRQSACFLLGALADEFAVPGELVPPDFAMHEGEQCDARRDGEAGGTQLRPD